MQNNLEIFNELIILFVKLLSVCSQNELVSRYLNNFKRDILTATEMFVRSHQKQLCNAESVNCIRGTQRELKAQPSVDAWYL